MRRRRQILGVIRHPFVFWSRWILRWQIIRFVVQPTMPFSRHLTSIIIKSCNQRTSKTSHGFDSQQTVVWGVFNPTAPPEEVVRILVVLVTVLVSPH